MTTPTPGFLCVSNRARCSVILVHDNGGHPRDTWGTKTFFWPEQHLPKKIENIRVLTFGYPYLPNGDPAKCAGDLLSDIEGDR
jgi:hypothetical protein